VVSVRLANLEACAPSPVPVKDANPNVAMVLAGCNALMEVEGTGLIGDPIELAALRGVDWRYEAKTQTAKPGNWEGKETQIEQLKSTRQKMESGSVQKAEADAKVAELTQMIHNDKERAGRSPIQAVVIKHRYHFSSQLQRMSVIAAVSKGGATSNHCLVKGSPEALGKLLAKGASPSYYERTYRELAESGLRVLALAYKEVGDVNGPPPSREWVESDLQFAVSDHYFLIALRLSTECGVAITGLRRLRVQDPGGLANGDQGAAGGRLCVGYADG
jgi:magnesium-transporting ATPase (P-type)